MNNIRISVRSGAEKLFKIKWVEENKNLEGGYVNRYYLLSPRSWQEESVLNHD